jgi:hypothetical protein
MITATPPAYCQVMDIEENQLRPRGASSDSDQIDEFAASALRFLVSSPRSSIADYIEIDDYVAPGLRPVAEKKVRIVKRGQLQPMPFQGEIE